MNTTTKLIKRLLQRNENGTLVEITEVDQQQAADLLEAQAKQIEALQAEAEYWHTRYVVLAQKGVNV